MHRIRLRLIPLSVGKLIFLNISNLVSRVLDEHEVLEVEEIDDVLEADRWATELSNEFVNKKSFLKIHG